MSDPFVYVFRVTMKTRDNVLRGGERRDNVAASDVSNFHLNFMNQLKAYFRSNLRHVLGICAWPLAGAKLCMAQPDPNWLDHDRARPLPTVVEPATSSSQEKAGKPPSDATVLFSGGDLSQWANMDGTPTKWIARDGYMESVKGSGYARTLQNFGDCQLHVEWATPA